MPQAVFIGIGGIGSAVVTHIQTELKMRVASAGDSPAAKTQAQNYQFLLVDTWSDENAQFFKSDQVFQIPTGADRFGVNKRIEKYWKSDLFFKHWWPTAKDGTPYRTIGDYHAGAGQFRPKGKLAYRISLDQGTNIVDGVNRAVNDIQNIIGDAEQTPIIPVYLVSSLGGGTGSGISLALAQHLRHTLPGNCQLIGVFPLASVTELGPPPGVRNSIRSNTDAALREIDYCMRQEGDGGGLDPFLAWGAAGVIPGDEPPFKYCYLFGRDNVNDKNLQGLDQYVRIIAETLTAESMSDLGTQDGLHKSVRSTHDNFISKLDRHPEKLGRSQAYASAAVASLVYPFERIEGHLGRQFTIAVLDQMLALPTSRVKGLVDDFVTDQRLAWLGNPPFRDRMLEPVELADEIRRISRFPRLQSVEDETYKDADHGRTLGYVEQVRTEFDKYIAERYRPHLNQRQPRIVAEHKNQLREYVEQILVGSGPSGLALAHGAVQELSKRLVAEERALTARIEGDPQAGTEGSLQRLTILREEWEPARIRLGKGFGSLRERKGQKAKAAFYKSAWIKLRDTTEEHEQLTVGRATYRQLVSSTREVEAVLGNMVTSLRSTRDNLERLTRTGLGQEGMSGVLDIALLDDPRLVASRFGELLATITSEGADKCATQLTAHPLPQEEDEPPASSPKWAGRVLESFHAILAGKQLNGVLAGQVEHDALAWGTRLLGDSVSHLTVWDALVAEYTARRQLNLPDQAVQDAVSLMEKDKQAVEQQNGTSPATGWESIAITYYIREKLNQAVNRAQPFWKLNPLEIAEHGSDLYRFVVFAADKSAYEAAASNPSLSLAGILEDAAKARGDSGSTAWIPGKDKITIYAREGVAPLFYLAAEELRLMSDATASMQSNNPYTDSRFEHLADPMIGAPQMPIDSARPNGREDELQGWSTERFLPAADSKTSAATERIQRRSGTYASRFRKK